MLWFCQLLPTAPIHLKVNIIIILSSNIVVIFNIPNMIYMWDHYIIFITTIFVIIIMRGGSCHHHHLDHYYERGGKGTSICSFFWPSSCTQAIFYNKLFDSLKSHHHHHHHDDMREGTSIILLTFLFLGQSSPTKFWIPKQRISQESHKSSSHHLFSSVFPFSDNCSRSQESKFTNNKDLQIKKFKRPSKMCLHEDNSKYFRISLKKTKRHSLRRESGPQGPSPRSKLLNNAKIVTANTNNTQTQIQIYRYTNTQAQSLLNDTKIVTAKTTYATLWRIKKIKKHELLEILDANKNKNQC